MTKATIKELIKNGVIEEPMDGNHGELHPTSKDYVTKGIPFIMASDIEDGCINYKMCKYITEKMAGELRKGFAKEGDVLLTHKATIGRTAIVKNINTKYIVLTPQVTYYRVLKEDIIDNRYLKYYFDSSKFQYILRKRAGAGSTRAYLGILQQQELTIEYPNIEIQRKIADILSTIDNKIENNKKINEELEVMAKTIYDYWFLQFEFPNEQGNPYKSSGGKIVWNDELKSEIPEGWDDGLLSDFGEVVSGGTPSTKHSEYYCDNGVAWITPNDLSNTSNKYILHGERDITELGLKNSSAKLMPKGTIILTTRAPIGYIAIAENELSTNQGFKSIIPNKEYKSEYIYYTIKSMIPYLKSLGTGSTFTEISKEVISNVKTIIPNDKIIMKFNEIVNPLGKKRAVIEKENKELEELRNFILPLLINQQVKFKEEK